MEKFTITEVFSKSFGTVYMSITNNEPTSHSSTSDVGFPRGLSTKKPAIHCASLTLSKSMSGGLICARDHHPRRRLNTISLSGKTIISQLTLHLLMSLLVLQQTSPRQQTHSYLAVNMALASQNAIAVNISTSSASGTRPKSLKIMRRSCVPMTAQLIDRDVSGLAL